MVLNRIVMCVSSKTTWFAHQKRPVPQPETEHRHPLVGPEARDDGRGHRRRQLLTRFFRRGKLRMELVIFNKKSE